MSVRGLDEVLAGARGRAGEQIGCVLRPGSVTGADKADPLPADAIGPKMARLHREHHRLLGNGHCTRPQELDCAFEAICENCSFFQTSIEFRPILQAQHEDAATKGQHHRATLFNQLLTGITEGEAS